ncbi:AraC family transcriptional regulator [Mycobacterium nebraskense]|uniref:HTH-type transcriptional regulator RipA n=1 Tax=Mycobacterium nebraskense TaxID=244292 RepID=A0A1X1ZH24_9MYCO|nr:helix-turn-helix transcriptional regulator [Mycobacterium nebraskense]KLO33906.1 AraC family transcriptional regulator [Mycobacterium nebraskense]MBI2694767.1 helix-turn-helix transcriptional regulator [Mycobacterium nebraskense]MCV7116177.1 helix-turn-helix transcriptional regulator [Mycobacterium nebraskense]ORW22649.1 AraC family transcriptional regulator [Mycobacterium nebraskense]
MSGISHHGRATSSQALPPGARIERHRHALHQIVYPSSGAVSVTTPAGTWITPANRAIWIPAGCWHEHKFHGHTQFHGVALDPSRYAHGPAAPAVLAVNPLMRELIIACSQTDGTDTDSHHRMLAVLHDQLQTTSSGEPLWIPTPVDGRLGQACAMIADNLREPLTLLQIGHRVGVSQRTLSRLFRDELAMTFPQWRTQLRLQHALVLLAEHRDVTSVAAECGWATPSAFIDTYRRAFGHTPGRLAAKAL